MHITCVYNVRITIHPSINAMNCSMFESMLALFNLKLTFIPFSVLTATNYVHRRISDSKMEKHIFLRKSIECETANCGIHFNLFHDINLIIVLLLLVLLFISNGDGAIENSNKHLSIEHSVSSIQHRFRNIHCSPC